MQEIIAQGAFRLNQLMDELIAQVPTFARVTNGLNDDNTGGVSQRKDDGSVRVTFADDINPILIQAVIDAHVPAPPKPPRDFKAELASVTDVAGLKTFLQDALRL